jgi:hypothetical protein
MWENTVFKIELKSKKAPHVNNMRGYTKQVCFILSEQSLHLLEEEAVKLLREGIHVFDDD